MRQFVPIAVLAAGGAALVVAVLRLSSALEGDVSVTVAWDAPDPEPITLEVAATPIALTTPVWAPVFGTAELVVPVAASPVALPAPLRFDYRLAGILAAGHLKWAILLGPSGEVLVREGDTLDGHARIETISASGLAVALGKELRHLAFDGARLVAAVPVPPTPEATPEGPRGNLDANIADQQAERATRPRVQEVIYTDMSRQELLAALNRAEEGRRQRDGARSETR